MERTYSAGDVIIREGDVQSSAFWIRKGRVEVSKVVKGRRIVLAVLDSNDPLFGEMSLIDDMPRSATVTALEPTTVEEISGQALHKVLEESPQTVQVLVRLLVNRIRGMNESILHAGVNLVQAPVAEVKLIATGPGARRLIPNEFDIQKFPFRIGRRPLHEMLSFSHRDLLLDDCEPFNVSRAHCSIAKVHEDIFLIDEGSALGTIVNGCRVGGSSGERQIRCDQGSNEIILGSPNSHHQFELRIRREDS